MKRNTSTSTSTSTSTNTNEVNPIHSNLPTMSAEDFLKEQGTKSNAIRALAALQVPTAAIAKYLDIRYQHARNVLQRPLKNPGQTAPTQAQQATPKVESAAKGKRAA
jgi:hypothetical protein